jgi:hypothetical protein
MLGKPLRAVAFSPLDYTAYLLLCNGDHLTACLKRDMGTWHPLSAPAETVDAYLTAFAGMLATSMLSRRRTVIRISYQVAGLDSPSEHPVAAVGQPRSLRAGRRGGAGHGRDQGCPSTGDR